MTEAPVQGPVPRFELVEWRERFGVVAGITGRGSESAPFDLGLAGKSAPVGEVMAHWRELRASLPEFSGIMIARQVHGTDLLRHESGRGLVIHGKADGQMSGTPGLLLAVSVADCIPVYLLDPVRRVIGLLHAGWRGVAGGVLAHGVAALRAHGSAVDNLLVHCGVGICGACYEVGSEVFAGCGLAPPAAGRGGLDLRAALREQALHLGLENISTSQFCTRHEPALFFSHRGSGGADGRQVAYLGLLP